MFSGRAYCPPSVLLNMPDEREHDLKRRSKFKASSRGRQGAAPF
jgi:hypothetical protein